MNEKRWKEKEGKGDAMGCDVEPRTKDQEQATSNQEPSTEYVSYQHKQQRTNSNDNNT